MRRVWSQGLRAVGGECDKRLMRMEHSAIPGPRAVLVFSFWLPAAFSDPNSEKLLSILGIVPCRVVNNANLKMQRRTLSQPMDIILTKLPNIGLHVVASLVYLSFA